MDVYIIIPFHNEEKYIDLTIQSIVEQSYPIKKLLLVDDNSNEENVFYSKKLCKKIRLDW